MRQLGGRLVIATAADMQLGRGETVDDTARVLSRMVDAVMIRTDDARRPGAASHEPRPSR